MNNSTTLLFTGYLTVALWKPYILSPVDHVQIVVIIMHNQRWGYVKTFDVTSTLSLRTEPNYSEFILKPMSLLGKDSTFYLAIRETVRKTKQSICEQNS